MFLDHINKYKNILNLKMTITNNKPFREIINHLKTITSNTYDLSSLHLCMTKNIVGSDSKKNLVV